MRLVQEIIYNASKQPRSGASPLNGKPILTPLSISLLLFFGFMNSISGKLPSALRGVISMDWSMLIKSALVTLTEIENELFSITHLLESIH